MGKFVCHKCRKEFLKKGTCSACGAVLEKVCSGCCADRENCMCTGSTGQTKGHAPK